MIYREAFNVEENEILSVLHKDMRGNLQPLRIEIILCADGTCEMTADHVGREPETANFDGLFDERDRLGLELALLIAARETQEKYRATKRELEDVLRAFVEGGNLK